MLEADIIFICLDDKFTQTDGDVCMTYEWCAEKIAEISSGNKIVVGIGISTLLFINFLVLYVG